MWTIVTKSDFVSFYIVFYIFDIQKRSCQVRGLARAAWPHAFGVFLCVPLFETQWPYKLKLLGNYWTIKSAFNSILESYY